MHRPSYGLFLFLVEEAQGFIWVCRDTTWLSQVD